MIVSSSTNFMEAFFQCCNPEVDSKCYPSLMTWMMRKSAPKQVCRWHIAGGSGWHNKWFCCHSSESHLSEEMDWQQPHTAQDREIQSPTIEKGLESPGGQKSSRKKPNIPQGRIGKFSKTVKWDDASSLLSTGGTHLKFCIQFCACI